MSLLENVNDIVILQVTSDILGLSVGETYDIFKKESKSPITFKQFLKTGNLNDGLPSFKLDPLIRKRMEHIVINSSGIENYNDDEHGYSRKNEFIKFITNLIGIGLLFYISYNL